MTSETKICQRLNHLMDKACEGDEEIAFEIMDLWRFLDYGPSVLSQLGMRWCGFVCRQSNGSTTMTVKALEADIPLVAYVTSATPKGCMRMFLKLCDNNRLSWHRDRYPWI